VPSLPKGSYLRGLDESCPIIIMRALEVRSGSLPPTRRRSLALSPMGQIDCISGIAMVLAVAVGLP